MDLILLMLSVMIKKKKNLLLDFTSTLGSLFYLQSSVYQLLPKHSMVFIFVFYYKSNTCSTIFNNISAVQGGTDERFPSLLGLPILIPQK